MKRTILNVDTDEEESDVSEFDKVGEDVTKLLKDLRSSIDEAIVKLDLAGKDARDVAQPLVERIENAWLEVKARLEG